MVYVQFKERKLNGIIDDVLGSDGVFILDGRNNLHTMIIDAEKRIISMSKIHTYEYYVIFSGSRIADNNRILYKNY